MKPSYGGSPLDTERSLVIRPRPRGGRWAATVELSRDLVLMVHGATAEETTARSLERILQHLALLDDASVPRIEVA